MKLKNTIISITLFLFLTMGYSQTQSLHNVYFNIPEYAILDIEPNTNEITLEFEPPTEPGEQLEPVTGNTKWINYTSTQLLGGTPKIITAQIANGTSIPGLSLELLISSYVGTGKGTLGISVGSVILSQTAKTIVSGIGGCFTNDGVSSGHEITYSAEITNYSLFEIPASTSVDILFTISN